MGRQRWQWAAGISLWSAVAYAEPASPEEVLVETDQEAAAALEVTTLTTEDRTGSQDLAAILSRATGVVVRRLGGLGAFSSVSIRGAGSQQVQVFLDGVPLNPDGLDVVNLSELPLAAVETVRLWRGYSPAAYGASPLGGVIDLVSPDPSMIKPRMRMGYGSFSTARGEVSAGVRSPSGKVDAWLAADILHTHGNFRYFSNQGTRYDPLDDRWLVRDNNDFVQGTWFGRGRVRLGQVTLGLMDALLIRDQGVPGPIGDPAAATRLETWRNLLTVWGEGRSGPVRWQSRLWHQGRGDTLSDEAGEVGLGAGVRRDVFHTAGAAVEIRGVVRRVWQLVGLVQGRADIHQGGAVEPATTRGVLGATFGVRTSALRDRVRGEVVVDTRGTLGAAAAWSGVLPRAELVLAPSPDVAVRASGGLGFRPPNLTELYGDRGAVVGNPTLRPERGAGVDLGVAWQASPHQTLEFRLQGTGFARWHRDRIAYVQNAQRSMVPVNFGRTRVLGAEGGFDLLFASVSRSQTRVTLTDARNLSDDPAERGRQLPGIPAWQVSQQVELTPMPWLVLGYRGLWMGRIAYDAVNWNWSTRRVRHALSLRLQPWKVGPSVELDVTNLTNDLAMNVPIDPLQPAAGMTLQAVTDVVGYPLPGRAWMLTLAWRPDRGPR